MDLRTWVDIGLLAVVSGAVYWGGQLRQQVSDQEREIERLRHRLDQFLDPYKLPDDWQRRGGC